MLTSCARIVEVAQAERGNVELPKGSHSNRSPRIDQYRPAWRRAELAAADARAGRPVKGEAWCSWFATWCWFEALAKHPLGHQIGGCYALARAAEDAGLWVDLDGVVRTDMLIAAYPGAAFVRLERPIAEGQSEGHVGIITGVSVDGWDVSTVEGNSGDGVRDGARKLDDPLIRGLVLPLGLEPARLDWPRGLVASADLGKLGTR